VIECPPKHQAPQAAPARFFQPFCKSRQGKSGIVATGIPAQFSLAFTTGFLYRISGPFVGSIATHSG
jgi:hypothetical protein